MRAWAARSVKRFGFHGTRQPGAAPYHHSAEKLLENGTFSTLNLQPSSTFSVREKPHVSRRRALFRAGSEETQ